MSDRAVLDSGFALHVYPSDPPRSALPETPAGRLDMVMELWKGREIWCSCCEEFHREGGGLIDDDEARRLLEMS